MIIYIILLFKDLIYINNITFLHHPLRGWNSLQGGVNYYYNLIINILAINNLNILGNNIVDIKYNKIPIVNIPKVNKLRK